MDLHIPTEAFWFGAFWFGAGVVSAFVALITAAVVSVSRDRARAAKTSVPGARLPNGKRGS